MVMNKCIKCETEIPGGSSVCPACGKPIKAMTRGHVWAPAMLGVGGAVGSRRRPLCPHCGRVGVKSMRLHRDLIF